jgi:ketosteroid isomerase-like protein
LREPDACSFRICLGEAIEDVAEETKMKGRLLAAFFAGVLSVTGACAFAQSRPMPIESSAELLASSHIGSVSFAEIHAQSTAPSDTLFTTIQALDMKLFDAYNHCDLTTLGAMVSDDLEFYHDQTGLSVGKAPFLAAIKQNICGKVQRMLLTDTLEVYPLKGYGAVEIGIHRFHHPGHPEDGMGDARFITLWQNKDGVWTVTRVISYDHNHGLLAK